MTPEQLRQHNLRNAAKGLRDVMRRRHPDLTFEIGVVEGGRFRPFPSGATEPVRLEATSHEPEVIVTPHPDHAKDAA